MIVVLDRHFAGAGTKLAQKAKKMDGTGTPIPSDGTSTPSKAGKDGASTPSSNAAFEDQARKAAQIIRAAGYALLCIPFIANACNVACRVTDLSLFIQGTCYCRCIILLRSRTGRAYD